MAETLAQRFDNYVKRRVKQLVELGWSDALIIQQLVAGVPRKLIVEVIAQTRQDQI
jgi:hypothetical protein